MSRQWMILDIDDTLSDARWRHEVAEEARQITDPVQRDKRWRDFHQMGILDSAIPATVTMVQLLVQQGMQVCYITGRPEGERGNTRRWLQLEGLPNEAPLYMRPPGVFTPSHEYKERMLVVMRQVFMQPDDTIFCAMDDHARCVAMYRRHGITVLQPWVAL